MPLVRASAAALRRACLSWGSAGSAAAPLSSLAGSLLAPQAHGRGCGCAQCSSNSSSSSSSSASSSPAVAPPSHGHGASCRCASCSMSAPTSAWPPASPSRLFTSPSAAAAAAAAADGDGKKEEGEPQQQASAAGEGGAEAAAGEDEEGEGGEEFNAEELLEKLKKQEESAEGFAEQVSKLTDNLKRNLAEMENLRMRTSREVDHAKKFAIQSFLKNILDVADNLERAYGAVPADALSEEEGKALNAEQLRKLLKGMMGGVATTEKVFLQCLRQQGVEQYNPQGEKFDPHFHQALFEITDPSKEPGIIGQVTKRGYTLNGRVIRPADVGVVRSSEE